jgi:hypothetical protein
VELLSIRVFKEMFQYSQYGKQFSSVGAIIPLCLVHRPTVVGYKPPLSVLNLGEHSSISDVAGVCVYYESLSWFGVGKNRDSTQGSLVRLKSVFYLWSPLKGLFLFCEFCQCLCNFWESRNKTVCSTYIGLESF